MSGPKPHEVPEDLSDLSDTGLRRLLADLEDAAGSIRLQLSEARSRFATEGVAADPRWYRKMSHALHQRQKVIRRVQVEHTRRREEKQGNKRRFVVERIPDVGCAAVTEFLNKSKYERLVGFFSAPAGLAVVWETYTTGDAEEEES